VIEPPADPWIYHITHVENLARILEDGSLLSDAEILRRTQAHTVVGMGNIKRRRLEECKVTCHPGTTVGEYVPFYFCPRSVMLYVLYMGNHPGLEYDGGQEPIVHLVADLLAWAEGTNTLWAFSDVNAASRYARFFSRVDDLGEIDWSAVEARDWRDSAVKDHKQAELLVYCSCPWRLVRIIGVGNERIAERVREAIRQSGHKPAVQVERSWYY